MSRRNATDTNSSSASPNKRVRIDATSAPASSGDTSAIKSTPLYVADTFIKNHIVSLQPQLASILGKLGQQHASLLHKLYNKKAQITRMESDEDFIPRSARIDFKFHMSKTAEERPEFLALQEETNTHIANFRKLLRQQIIKATKIESDTLTEEIKIGFVKVIRVSTEAFLIGDDTGVTPTSNLLHATVSALMGQRHATLLRHTTFTSFDTFCDTYKRFHNLSEFPLAPTGPDTSAAAASRFFSPNNNNQSTPANQSVQVPPVQLDKIARAIESVFIFPFDEYLKQCKKNQISLSLKKLFTMHFTEESTNDSQMHLDQEPAADRVQLQSLIKKQTQAETKSLAKALNQLQEKIKALESKKSSRGQSVPPGASPKQVRPSTAPQKGNDKAAGSAKGSNSNKGNKKSQTVKNSTKKNNSRSRTKRGN
mmetsp:Transcript_6411/g.12091  ORF Transcript_6411/g.12091 Transcript_6411/m.12091 type:complete len:425 (+) Transcript_6411:357-1631(+)